MNFIGHMDETTIIISLCTLFFSLFTYIKHERRIKKQEVALNEYQIEKIETEKKEARKAIIEAKVVDGERGKRIIKVYNRGRSIAEDVFVIFPEKQGLYILGKNLFPIDIRPTQSIDIFLAIAVGAPNKITIDFQWKDDFQELNKESQTIQL